MLRTLFDQTCQAYFPRWRAAAAWTVLFEPPPGYLDAWGLCERETRRIWVHADHVKGDSARAVACLVHEIVHAVVGCSV
ncbi:MAG: hypothetical protein FJ109_10000, partial [Deltaproteobacteria bacterium]|nr:hypothetical protein [Deltaproteobacteria bacterium]